MKIFKLKITREIEKEIDEKGSALVAIVNEDDTPVLTVELEREK